MLNVIGINRKIAQSGVREYNEISQVVEIRDIRSLWTSHKQTTTTKTSEH